MLSQMVAVMPGACIKGNKTYKALLAFDFDFEEVLMIQWGESDKVPYERRTEFQPCHRCSSDL